MTYDYEDGELQATKGPSIYVFGFYELDRQYGGPEEGGWWYDTQTLERPWMIKRCTAEKMHAIVGRANRLLQHLQRNKRSTGSMAYSGGRHSVSAFENRMPAHLPEHRPHYE